MPRRVCYRRGDPQDVLRSLEWLVPNGLGGYASGTIAGEPTRRFHGALIAAMPPPLGRMLAVGPLDDFQDLQEFALEDGLPVWTYVGVEKRISMPHGRNLTVVTYRAKKSVSFSVRPWLSVRKHEGRVDAPARGYPVHFDGQVCEIDRGSSMPIRFIAEKGQFVEDKREREVRYAVEEARGYDHQGPLVSPCELQLSLAAGEEATLALTVEPAAALDAARLHDEEVQRRRAIVEGREGLVAELALAADAFVVRKVSGAAEDRTVIAGYHWFTDWGRDTMISLDGLCLARGQFETAARILRTFASHVRDGLIPNLFPEGESQGLYHTADATLWFFHALHRYTEASKDPALVQELLPKLSEMVEAHLEGTRFGIGVDPADGLLRQGAPGYQLTWMDAKVGDYVVTPRRGKAVEINALFYNALRLYQSWTGKRGAEADRLRTAFNQRFFDERLGRLKDVVDPDDASLRPNQIFAISLPHPVLDEARWKPVLESVRRELLTPVGLRSLGPREPAYKPRYDGDLPTRDAAYHQGTVWAWLIGPFVDAVRKVYPGEDVRPLLAGFDAQLQTFGAGTLAEIFDAEPPHLPRGCIAQAWSVAEVLRCLSTYR
ncbi:MAG TPA: amylo-alpha-1,6-glucosidase [Myxococcales bacterium]|jgi:predicted glycogen debranching enzyme